MPNCRLSSGSLGVGRRASGVDRRSSVVRRRCSVRMHAQAHTSVAAAELPGLSPLVVDHSLFEMCGSLFHVSQLLVNCVRDWAPLGYNHAVNCVFNKSLHLGYYFK